MTSDSICSFVPRMTNVRLNVRKLQVQHTLDGSDKSDEVWRRLRGPRLSSTPGIDGAYTVSMYNKSAPNEWALKDPQQGENIRNIFGTERRPGALTLG